MVPLSKSGVVNSHRGFESRPLRQTASWPLSVRPAGADYAARMTEVGAGLSRSAPGAAVWRRPPFAWPAGRGPSSARTLAIIGVLFLFYLYYLAGGALAGGMLASWSGIIWPAALPFLVICAAGVGYGLAVIATAGRPRVTLMLRDWGLGGSTAAKVWFGLAYILPLAVSLATGWVIGPAGPSSAVATPPLSWLVELVGPAAFAVCLILARVCSLGPVRRAIVAGQAPSFKVWEDRAWWWDGGAWADWSVAAPESALRSPDGNYWWSGQGWLPLPPRPQRP